MKSWVVFKLLSLLPGASTIRLYVFAALLTACATCSVWADQSVTVYQDTFSTDGFLNGRSVEVGSGTWIAYSDLPTTSGKALPGATVNGKHALIEFTPQSGKVYELSADLNLVSGSTFLSLGFCADNDTPSGDQLFIRYEDSAAPWMCVSTNGTVATMTGPASDGYEAFSGRGTSGQAKIVLDTTGNNWKAVWYFNNNALRTNVFSGSLNITHVAFGGQSLDATVDNFALTTDLAVHFDMPGNFEGWDNPYNVQNVSVSGGVLQGTTVTADPYIFNNALIANADKIKTIYVRMNANMSGTSQFCWRNGSSYYFSDLPYSAVNNWQILGFDVSSNASWTGTVDYLRIDPVAAAGANFQVDWIIDSDGDFDNDWIDDNVEGVADIDGDGLENFRDSDSDGDGTGDKDERLSGRNPFDVSDMAFFFDRNGDYESWVPGNVTNTTVSNSILSGVSTSVDPHIDNTICSVNSDMICSIYVKLLANNSGRTVLYWKHDGQQEQMGLDYTNTGNWQVMSFDVGNHAGWTGIVDFLRIDPFLTANDAFSIDWIIASDGDLDKDGIPDVTDGLNDDADGDGLENFRDTDSDGNGIRDGTHTAYYVSNSGSDLWDGLAPAYGGGIRGPWRTLQRAANTVFSPGNVLLLECGSVFQGAATLQGSGTTDNPCTILSYGSGNRPIIEHTGGVGLSFSNDAWEVKGLEIRDCAVGIQLDWKNKTDWEYFRFDDLYMHNISIGAFYLSTTGNTNPSQTIFRDIKVSNSLFEYNNKVWGTYTTTNNAGWNTFNDLLFDGCAFISNGYDVVSLQYVTYGTVRNCYFSNNGSANHASSGVLLQHAKYCSVVHSDILGTKRYEGLFDGQGIDFEGNCSDCLVDDVYIADCDGAAILFFNKDGQSHRNLEVRNCTFYNNSINPHPDQAYYDLIFYGHSTGEIHNNIWQHRPEVTLAGVGSESYAGFSFHDNHELLSVICEETFSIDGSLAGRMAEAGVVAWQTDAAMMTSNGVAYPATTVNAKVAAVPFTPQTGAVYTLSADLSAVSGGYLALGFLSETNSVAITGQAFFDKCVDEESPWMFTQPNSMVWTFLGSGTGGAENEGALGSNGTAKIVLNTMGDNWVVEWYFNNVLIRTHIYAGSLNITHVGFGSYPVSSAIVDNFTLKVAPQ